MRKEDTLGLLSMLALFAASTSDTHSHNDLSRNYAAMERERKDLQRLRMQEQADRRKEQIKRDRGIQKWHFGDVTVEARNYKNALRKAQNIINTK